MKTKVMNDPISIRKAFEEAGKHAKQAAIKIWENRQKAGGFYLEDVEVVSRECRVEITSKVIGYYHIYLASIYHVTTRDIHQGTEFEISFNGHVNNATVRLINYKLTSS